MCFHRARSLARSEGVAGHVPVRHDPHGRDGGGHARLGRCQVPRGRLPLRQQHALVQPGLLHLERGAAAGAPSAAGGAGSADSDRRHTRCRFWEWDRWDWGHCAVKNRCLRLEPCTWQSSDRSSAGPMRRRSWPVRVADAADRRRAYCPSSWPYLASYWTPTEPGCGNSAKRQVSGEIRLRLVCCAFATDAERRWKGLERLDGEF